MSNSAPSIFSPQVYSLTNYLRCSNFRLLRFVNTLCIPSQPWIPIGAKCYMSGKSYQSLKDGIPVTLRSVCDRVNDNDYKV